MQVQLNRRTDVLWKELPRPLLRSPPKRQHFVGFVYLLQILDLISKGFELGAERSQNKICGHLKEKLMKHAAKSERRNQQNIQEHR